MFEFLVLRWDNNKHVNPHNLTKAREHGEFIKVEADNYHEAITVALLRASKDRDVRGIMLWNGRHTNIRT